MKKSVIIGVVILAVALIAMTLLFTKTPIKKTNQAVSEKITKQGLGSLCSGEENCKEFCLNNRGKCEDYCKGSKNELCNKLFSNIESPPNPVIPKNPEINKPEIKKDERPVLKNLGVNIEPWNKQTNLAGDLIFSRDLIFNDGNIMNDWVFIEFGSQGQRRNDPLGNIEYWFFVPIGTNVIAPIDGTIQIGFFEHTQDWGIDFFSSDRKWIVGFEHVVDVKVKDGDIVKAGDIVAKAAPRGTYNNKIAMTELAVWGGEQNVIKYCPFDFLDESLKPIYEEKLKRLASDWEEFIGKNVYEEEKWVSPGCLKDKIIEK